jgi:hypothetical protein
VQISLAAWFILFKESILLILNVLHTMGAYLHLVELCSGIFVLKFLIKKIVLMWHHFVDWHVLFWCGIILEWNIYSNTKLLSMCWRNFKIKNLADYYYLFLPHSLFSHYGIANRVWKNWKCCSIGRIENGLAAGIKLLFVNTIIQIWLWKFALSRPPKTGQSSA